MNEERRKILEMLSEGKITAEDAERLMEKIEGSGSEQPSPPEADKPARKGKIRYLRVLVDSADGDKVNIRVPVKLIRTGVKLGAVLPQHASDKLNESGFDLGGLAGLADDELIEALEELQVDVDSNDGDTVRIFCE
jgi:hypothetical protein